MAGNLLLVSFLLALGQLASATSAEELRVFVPENVAVGETIFGPSRLPEETRAEEKAELPCEKMEGDTYGRFNVTENCTVVVANPLDWSEQSVYLLHIRHDTSIKVELTDIEGYPPVYNETCETPVNHNGQPGEMLFSPTVRAEAMTTDGGLFVFRRTYGTVDDIWVHETVYPWMVHTENSDCTIRIASYVSHHEDLTMLEDLWINNIDQTSCSAGSELPTLVINLYSLRRSDSNSSKLMDLTKYVPKEIVFDKIYQFIGLFSLTILTKDKETYHCEVPSFDYHIRTAHAKLTSIEYFDIHVKPVGCPVGKYGFLCDKSCICKNGARCHGFNGACKCPPGWKGVACDIPKPEVSIELTPSDLRYVYISANLTFRCKAHHIDVKTVSLTFPNASQKVSIGVREIDIVLRNVQPKDDGPYTCMVEDTEGKTHNTNFVFSVTNCPPNHKGAHCEERCDCQQGASCDRWAGCVCPPGWTGTRCQTQCPYGRYGKNCSKDCICLNGAGCGLSDGRCNCTGGWYGKDCSKPCPSGRYGWGCHRACSCKNNATCNNEDGSCACVTPWTGRYCDQWQTSRDEPLLESLVPLGSLVLLVTIVMTLLYKMGVLNCSAPDTREEDKILFELKRMEQDLAQSLQPGWLGRWEKKISHLAPGPLIGEGMFGQVRRAQLRTPKGKLDVAAKTVRVEDSQSYRDFYREAAILVSVHQEQHCDGRQSNIVRLVGLITKSEEKYILLEYAPKGDLLGYLRRIRDADQEDLLGNLLGYAVHIARALQELERLRIAHRDVAARNVLITADDVAKLADFGLARDVYATTQYVRCNRPGVDELLPLKWMALESIETGEYTCQSDVWSFGVLLWEIATLGKDPNYDGRVQLSFLQMVGILRQGIRMKRPPGCPEDLYRLMRACWRDVPATRPTPDGIEQSLLQLIHILLPHEAIEMETAV
ncbi:uncharacterized protein LOC144872599 [Branchiostoma floridae x Branchiostoma japonicum]